MAGMARLAESAVLDSQEEDLAPVDLGWVAEGAMVLACLEMVEAGEAVLVKEAVGLVELVD